MSIGSSTILLETPRRKSRVFLFAPPKFRRWPPYGLVAQCVEAFIVLDPRDFVLDHCSNNN